MKTFKQLHPTYFSQIKAEVKDEIDYENFTQELIKNSGVKSATCYHCGESYGDENNIIFIKSNDICLNCDHIQGEIAEIVNQLTY